MATHQSSLDIENASENKPMIGQKDKDSDFIPHAKSNKVASSTKGPGNFAAMTPAQKASLFSDINRKKKRAQIIFYDYVADEQDFLSIEFLKNPFMDFETLEHLSDAHKSLK